MAKKTATLARNQHGERVVSIKFPFNFDDLERVRSLPGRKFHNQDKCWSAPPYHETLKRLKSWGFEFSNVLEEYFKQQEKRKTQLTAIDIPALKGELLPYQKTAIAFLEINKGRALIADEMGLGKTIESIAWLQLHRDKTPVLIVTPASLKLNWLRELQKWMPAPSVEIVSGRTPYQINSDIIIINYDILWEWSDALLQLSPQVLVADECSYFKANAAKRTKAIKKIAKRIPHLIFLSGSPIENRPIEIYNAWKLLDPVNCPEHWYFCKHYCDAKYNGFGWDMTGHAHIDELHQQLKSTIMIRRKKQDVLQDLPDKMRSFIPTELDNIKEYKEAEQNFIAFVKKTKGKETAEKMQNAEALTSIEGLKQIAVQGKLKHAMEWIKDFLSVEDKLVVFAVHKFVIDELMTAFSKIAVKVDGSVSMEARQKAVDDFQKNPNTRLFIGNIQAAGKGLTLTASANVAFLELPWTPGEIVQAEDRCHRIGQKRVVNIYYLLAIDTIEERIAKLLDVKRKIIDGVLDGVETGDESLLHKLIEEYKNI